MPVPLGVVASQRSSAATEPPAGMLGWWDAADDSTFTYLSGSLIGQWRDKSGNDHHANTHDANSAWAPTRVAATINGLAAVSHQTSGVIGTNLAAVKPFTAIAAIKTGAASGNQGLLGRGNGDSTGGFSWDHNNGTLRLMRESVAQIGAASSAYAANTATVIGVSYGSGDAWAHHRDGVAVGSGTTAGTFVATNVSIGGFFAPNGGPYNGHIGEVLYYNTVLSTGDRQQAEAYLKAKWGTP